MVLYLPTKLQCFTSQNLQIRRSINLTFRTAVTILSLAPKYRNKTLFKRMIT